MTAIVQCVACERFTLRHHTGMAAQGLGQCIDITDRPGTFRQSGVSPAMPAPSTCSGGQDLGAYRMAARTAQRGSLMSNQITFYVPGLPKGKGRTRTSTRIGRDKRIGALRAFTRQYTPEETAAYESLVKLAAARAMTGRGPYAGAVQMHLHIVMPIPQSRSGERQCRAGAGHMAPTVRPGSDNVERAVKDGCNGVVY